MNGISRISGLRPAPIRMGSSKDPDGPTGTPGTTEPNELPPGPPLVRQRGVRREDPFRTPDLPPATEANEAAMLGHVKALFAPELADPTRLHVGTETRSLHGQRQLGVTLTYYANHPSFVHATSPTDTQHTIQQALDRLQTLGQQPGIVVNKVIPYYGLVVNGIPIKMVQGFHLAPNQVVVGGGLVGTLEDGSEGPPLVRQ